MLYLCSTFNLAWFLSSSPKLSNGDSNTSPFGHGRVMRSDNFATACDEILHILLG